MTDRVQVVIKTYRELAPMLVQYAHNLERAHHYQLRNGGRIHLHTILHHMVNEQASQAYHPVSVGQQQRGMATQPTSSPGPVQEPFISSTSSENTGQ